MVEFFLEKKNSQFMKLTPKILKQGQGHPTWYELVDHKQGYTNAKFEKPHLNSVR